MSKPRRKEYERIGSLDVEVPTRARKGWATSWHAAGVCLALELGGLLLVVFGGLLLLAAATRPVASAAPPPRLGAAARNASALQYWSVRANATCSCAPAPVRSQHSSCCHVQSGPGAPGERRCLSLIHI